MQAKAFPSVRERLRLALQEDLGSAGDVTSLALVPAGRASSAVFLAKANGVVSGTVVLQPVFELVAELTGEPLPAPAVNVRLHDGAPVKKGDVIAEVSGSARVLLAGERTALNMLSHLSGVATMSARFAERIAHTRAKVLDTRKTTPLWRDLEKAAVVHGGGTNHRYALYDMVLIKDNHLALWGAQDPAGAVREARRAFPAMQVEVEVTDLAGLQNVCRESDPDYVLLDNFSREQLAEAVAWAQNFFSAEKNRRAPLLEASGGVNLESVAALAETGVDRISAGALTHSVPALDISLEINF